MIYLRWRKGRETLVTRYDAANLPQGPKGRIKTPSGLRSAATFYGRKAGYVYDGQATHDEWVASIESKRARRRKPLGMG